MKCFTKAEIKELVTKAWDSGYLSGFKDNSDSDETEPVHPTESSKLEFDRYLDVTMRNIG